MDAMDEANRRAMDVADDAQKQMVEGPLKAAQARIPEQTIGEAATRSFSEAEQTIQDAANPDMTAVFPDPEEAWLDVPPPQSWRVSNDDLQEQHAQIIDALQDLSAVVRQIVLGLEQVARTGNDSAGYWRNVYSDVQAVEKAIDQLGR